MKRLRSALAALAIILVTSSGPTAGAQESCRFVMGFAALREMIGAQKVGTCLEDEHFNLENGNAEQRTSGGLMVWRKADNFTAFTDGGTSWINGPNGLQSRPNSERFAWEKDPPSSSGSQPAAAPRAPAPPAPSRPSGSTQTAIPQMDINSLFPTASELPTGYRLTDTQRHDTGDALSISQQRLHEVPGKIGSLYITIWIARSTDVVPQVFQREVDVLRALGYEPQPCKECNLTDESLVAYKIQGQIAGTVALNRYRAVVYRVISLDPADGDSKQASRRLVDLDILVLGKILGAYGERTGAQASTPPQSAPVPTPTTASPSGREVLTNVAGQQAEGIFRDQRIRATVREMTIATTLPAVQSRDWGNHSERVARGKFVVVLAQVENIGNGPACCLPGFRLRDSRGRFFSGDTNQADQMVKHGAAAIYPVVTYTFSDYQPNLPIPRVFVYDIPTDATGLVLASDGR